MTVSTLTTSIEYTGTGANTALAIPYEFNAHTELVVVRRVTATAAETTMVKDTDYTVSGGLGTTGTVTPIDGATDFPSSVTWNIVRTTPITQDENYIDGDDFPADSHEEALDKLTRICQEILDAESYILSDSLVLNPDQNQARFVRAPEEDEPIDMVLGNTAARLGKIIQFNAVTGKPDLAVLADLSGDVITFSAYFLTLVNVADGDELLNLIGGLKDVLTTRGDMLYEGAADPTRLPIGTSSDMVLSTDTTDPVWKRLSDIEQPSVQNVIINGEFRAWQRGLDFTSATTPDNSTGNFTADRWRHYHDSVNGWNAIRSTGADGTNHPEGYNLNCVAAGNNKKAGIWHIVARADCRHMRSVADGGGLGKVSLSFEMAKNETGGTITSVKAAIVAWSGTANHPLDAPITAWNGAGVNPSLDTDLAYCTSVGEFTPTTSRAKYKLEDVTVPDGMNNLIVFIWIDSTTAGTTDNVKFFAVNLVLGETIPDNVPVPNDTMTMIRCSRYYRKTFSADTQPADAVADEELTGPIKDRRAGEILARWDFGNADMWQTPTITLYNPEEAGVDEWHDYTTGAGNSVAAAVDSVSDKGVVIKGALGIDNKTYGIAITAESELYE